MDNHVIEYVNFVTRVIHTPVKHPDNPIVKTDKPWEVTSYFRTNTWNVHWDERESIYKLWYEDMGWDYDEFMRLERSGEGRKEEEVAAIASYDATIDNRLLYASSPRRPLEGSLTKPSQNPSTACMTCMYLSRSTGLTT